MQTRILALGLTAAIAAMLALPPAQAQQPATQQDRMKSCTADAKAQKLKGDARSSFMKSCLSGEPTTPRSGTTEPSGGRSANAPPPSGTTAPPAGKATATSLAAGQFANEADARRHCPSDQVVWVNTASKVYHFVGTRDYGHTKAGAFMCQHDSDKAGYRAARNETPPGQKP